MLKFQLITSAKLRVATTNRAIASYSFGRAWKWTRVRELALHPDKPPNHNY